MSSPTISTPAGRSGFFVPVAAIGVALSILGGVERGCAWLQAREVAAKTAAEKERRLYERLEALERWQCVQGWRPPETRDSARICPEKER